MLPWHCIFLLLTIVFMYMCPIFIIIYWWTLYYLNCVNNPTDRTLKDACVLWDHVFSGYMQGGIAGSYGNSILIFKGISPYFILAVPICVTPIVWIGLIYLFRHCCFVDFLIIAIRPIIRWYLIGNLIIRIILMYSPIISVMGIHKLLVSLNNGLWSSPASSSSFLLLYPIYT